MRHIKGIILFGLLASGFVPAQAQTLRVLSYNIHHGCDTAEQLQLKGMAKVIRQSGADIVGLQEVDSLCRRSGQTNQTRILGKLTGLEHAFVRHFPYDGGSYGLALLSRYPILSVTNKRLPVGLKNNGSTVALLCATVQPAAGKTVEVWVAHLDYRSERSRLRQAVLLDSMIRETTRPLMLIGDLNAPPADSAIRLLQKQLQNGGSDGGFTYPVADPVRKIDYILVDKQHFSISDGAKVLPVFYSDHRPVLNVVKLER